MERTYTRVIAPVYRHVHSHTPLNICLGSRNDTLSTQTLYSLWLEGSKSCNEKHRNSGARRLCQHSRHLTYRYNDFPVKMNETETVAKVRGQEKHLELAEQEP